MIAIQANGGVPIGALDPAIGWNPCPLNEPAVSCYAPRSAWTLKESPP